MTADDTFRVLSRPGFEEMQLLLIRFHDTPAYYMQPMHEWKSLSTDFLKKHGWGYDEYLDLNYPDDLC